ncbi:MAG TPA: hypothetical protein PKV86_07400 [Syntrophobacteraceae bacterium]|nr:hypothetical protein [Syntrophobacteraceae bacterium]
MTIVYPLNGVFQGDGLGKRSILSHWPGFGVEGQQAGVTQTSCRGLRGTVGEQAVGEGPDRDFRQNRVQGQIVFPGI